MINQILKLVFGSQNDRELKKITPLVSLINEQESKVKNLSDEQLKQKTNDFKQRILQGESLDSIRTEAFSVVREASIRVLGMRHFDVQLIGGLVLHSGKIAEMKTGEGKTLTATLPVYLNALSGKGVHVVTVNDYLARRDAEWMGRLYGFLGLSTGCVLGGMSSEEKRAAYDCDITYGQNNEFGFDYLRDNMKLELSERSQRGHNFAIVDEVDSILVDEARTPLIISGPSEKPAQTYQVADQLVRKLKSEKDFEVDLKSKQVTLTDEGVIEVEKLLNVGNLYDPQNIELIHHVQQALKAHITMKRDVDYVVRDGQVIIVDEFTGRLMSGRRWSDGLHQAVEAKEAVRIQRENQTLATITFQNYFRMYEKLAGMTGTADTEAVEFRKIYNLSVVVVPTNLPMIRKDRGDIVFIKEETKFKAVVDDIKRCYESGQPVLVGTASIEKSELLSSILDQSRIPHNVLNAKQHEREAEIVAQAGRVSAVTISTNMAGRGTDILLGGNPEFLAYEMANTKDIESEEFRSALVKAKEICIQDKKRVLDAGGLHIIGTERHESRRIDNQLRGRSGRQGDPGSSQFFISLEDDLMKRFGGEKLQALMFRLAGDEDPGIEGWAINNSIERAQRRVEGHHFEIRKHLLEYDDVLSKQREVVYGLREKILNQNFTKQNILDLIDDVLEHLILSKVEASQVREHDALLELSDVLKKQLGVELGEGWMPEVGSTKADTFAQLIFDKARVAMRENFDHRINRIGEDRLLHLERIIHLQAIDHFWKEHLTLMDNIRDGINLRAHGQKNPLHEYQREGFLAFDNMMRSVNFSVAQHILLVELPSEEEMRAIEEKEKEALKQREQSSQSIHPGEGSQEVSENSEPKLNREQRRKKKGK